MENDDWIRVKQTRWLHEKQNRTIEIAAVLEPELEQNFIVIDDHNDTAFVIGYFKNLRKSVIGVEEYITLEDEDEEDE